MEDQQNIPPEIAELHSKSMRVEGIIAKKQNIASTIGTPEFQGPETFIPPTPDHPNYLKELVATTIASSRVRRVIEQRSLPALEQIHRSLQEEIAHRQELLSDAAEYTVNLQELRELQGEGVLTNQSVIGMVEDALRKIDEELHSQPVIASKTPGVKQGREVVAPVFATTPTLETTDQVRAPGAIDTIKLTALRQIAEGHPLGEVMATLNQSASNNPFTQDGAERFLNSLFTKLFGRVTRNEADAEELKAWEVISGHTPSLVPSLIRDDFRDQIFRNFHPNLGPRTTQGRRTREPREKKPVDPSELIHSVLERVSGRGVKVGLDQRFNPLQVKEVFGSHRRKDELAVEREIVTPAKRRGNDYHPSYTLVEAIQMAVIPKFVGATKEQLEELPVLIELEVERWMKEHADIVGAK